jgi:hypothetical protein
MFLQIQITPDWSYITLSTPHNRHSTIPACLHQRPHSAPKTWARLWDMCEFDINTCGSPQLMAVYRNLMADTFIANAKVEEQVLY